MALADYFLKIDGIEGESNDSKHKAEIDLLSWSWGVSQTGSFAYGGGGGSGKANFHDISFMKKIDKSSPKLIQACATGEHIKKAILTARKAGKDQQEYLKFTFTDVLVSSYQTNGSGAGDPIPMDSISLNYGKIEVEYKEQKADGTLGGVVKAGYNVKENKKV